jgi:hypothetical protein
MCEIRGRWDVPGVPGIRWWRVVGCWRPMLVTGKWGEHRAWWSFCWVNGGRLGGLQGCGSGWAYCGGELLHRALVHVSLLVYKPAGRKWVGRRKWWSKRPCEGLV